MILSHNISALNTQRQYKITTKQQEKSTEKLSSGYKINRAADNAAGLAISEKMRRLIRGLDRGADNITEGISLVQTADGALEEVIENLQRVRELSIAAYNETNSKSDIAAMQAEVDQILTEIDRIGETTTFNSKKILQGNKTYYAGKSPDRIETYIEETQYGRKIPDWLWDKSSHSMAFGNDRGNSATTGSTGVMYTTETDSSGNKKIVYYGPEISDPEYGAEWRGNWTNELTDNACAVLDFSGLADMSTAEDLYGALIDLLGVKLAYPCGTCGDERSCVNFIGTVDNLPFTVPRGTSTGTDRVSDIDLSTREFSYTTTNGGVTETHDEKNGYFQAITDLMDRHDSDTSMTDAQKQTEFKALASAIAKDLASQVFTSLNQTSQSHFDRVIQDQTNPDYSMIIFDYRDKSSLTSAQQATSPVISEVEGYITVAEEKTRVIAGEDLYAQEGIMIVPGTEYEKSIELTLPKITLDELKLKGYRLGTQYTTQYSYEYGTTAKSKYDDAMRQYENDMKAYQKQYEQYQQDYLDWKATGTLVEIKTPVLTQTTSTKVVDGHMKTEIISSYSYATRQYTQYSTPAPTAPDVPTKPELSDFKEYSEVTITKILREDTLDPVDKAIAKVLETRSILGAQQNRLEHAYNINKNTQENEQSAESSIRDTDMSEEMVKQSKNNILVQVGQAMMAQANQQPQNVMKILQ